MTAPKTQSWDEFWAEVSPHRTEVIRGLEVKVPTDMPLAVEKRITELRASEAEEDIGELLHLLFDVSLDEWRDAGMGLRELQTVLTWGIAQASGKDLTFAEAHELVVAGEGEGKPLAPKGQPNRAARRAPSKSTGGQSKRTSSGSTGSARARSRA